MYKLNLRLFDGEGAPAAAEGQAEAAAEVAAEPQQEVDRDAEFEALIKGDYKDQFESRVKKNLDRRFKAAQKTEAALANANKIIEQMKMQYGVFTDEELSAALAKDTDIVRRRAAENGLTEEQQRRMDRLEYDSKAHAEALRQQEEEARTQQTLLKWRQEEEAMRNTFPDFSLDEESGNEQFMQLLSSGVSMDAAYKCVHMDDIIGGTLQYAVAKTKEKVTNDIRARGLRPTENGAQGSVAARVVKKDPSTWTDKEMDDVIRRVRSGELITL